MAPGSLTAQTAARQVQVLISACLATPCARSRTVLDPLPPEAQQSVRLAALQANRRGDGFRVGRNCGMARHHQDHVQVPSAELHVIE